MAVVRDVMVILGLLITNAQKIVDLENIYWKMVNVNNVKIMKEHKEIANNVVQINA